jgi:hypothetical protein
MNSKDSELKLDSGSGHADERMSRSVEIVLDAVTRWASKRAESAEPDEAPSPQPPPLRRMRGSRMEHRAA